MYENVRMSAGGGGGLCDYGTSLLGSTAISTPLCLVNRLLCNGNGVDLLISIGISGPLQNLPIFGWYFRRPRVRCD